MTEERKKVSPEQLEILINELEKDQSLINGPRTSAQGRTNYNAKWEELAEKLNSVEGGALKNFTKWQQSLRDWRNNTKKKIAAKSSGQGDGAQELTNLESRLMALCNNEPPQAKTDVSSISEVDPLSAENSSSDEEAPYPNTHTTYVCDEENEQSGDETKLKVKRRRVQVMSEDVISQQNKLLDRLTALEASRQESENRQNQLLEGVTLALDRHAAATAGLTRAADVQAHVLTQILHILREGRQEN